MIALEKQGGWYIILVSKYSLDNNSMRRGNIESR